MDIPHYNVVFATPGSSFTPGYMNSILMTVHSLNEAGLSWFFLSESSSHVAVAREATVAGRDHWLDGAVNVPRNGEFTYDKMMWIDSDIQWGPSDFGTLYYSDKDIVSGCYLMPDRTTPIFMNPLAAMMAEQDLLQHEDLFKAHAIGFGFVCIKSGVFEAIKRPWFSNLGSEEQFGLPIIMGEDVAFCVNARNAGFDIWVDPRIRVTHTKTVKVGWM